MSVEDVVREVVLNAGFTVNPNEALVPVFVDLVRVQADGTKVVPSIYPNGDLRYTKSELDCVENGTFRVTSLGGKTLAVFPVSGTGAIAVARAERDRLIDEQDYEAAANFRDRVIKPLEELERKREDPVRDDAMRSWMDAARAQGLAEAKRMEETILAEHHKCMVCGKRTGTHFAIVTVYGGETAVLACPNCDAFGYAIEKFGAEGAHSVKLKEWRPVGKFTDVRRDADGVSGTFHAFAEIKEEPPMPTTKPVPDPHAECRLSLRDGVLVDDYGRKLTESSVDARTNCGRLWLDVTVPHSCIPPDGTRPPAAQPEPIFLQCSELIPSAEVQRIVDDFQRIHMPVVLLPPYITRAAHPEEDALRADISRRADLGNAYRRGKRVGLAFGAAVLALFVGLSVTVARVRPAWAIKVVAWVAGQGR